MTTGTAPIQSFMLGIPTSSTIAATMAGTAAATVISSSISCAGARGIEVFNLTGRNIELVIGPDSGTATYTNTTVGTSVVCTVGNGTFFCPGTAAAAAVSMGLGRGVRFPIVVHQGMKLSVRTTENTPITCASTTPLIISLWT